jgi:hypothetical protein
VHPRFQAFLTELSTNIERGIAASRVDVLRVTKIFAVPKAKAKSVCKAKAPVDASVE